MYAPHPSLVPFELAQAGALVVTNVYSNRDEAFLTGISSNIVPASLTLESITDRLVDVLRAADRRTAKTCQHFCGHWPASWEEACETIATRLVAEDLV